MTQNSRTQSKVRSLRDAVAGIPDGATVALGGSGLVGRPVALARELARQRRRALHLLCFGIGIDARLLVDAGAVERIDCAADEDASGLCEGIRRTSTAPILERHDAVVMRAALGAGAGGTSFQPLAEATVAGEDAWLKPCTCPFSGVVAASVAAVRPNLAIIHAQLADRDGNARLAPTHMGDDVDLLLARAATTVIVSVEQIVSRETIAALASQPLLDAAKVSCVVEAPYGAWPYGFGARYRSDDAMCDEFSRAARCEDSFAGWLRESALGEPDHDACLQRIGARRLLALATQLYAKA
ncbi:CoA-transferase [Paraburkholderia sp. B3]|uniref:CoA-transferase n=1 Tax=Paraburkholderia sp. B3 TaxID=3134791 RepID=UPI0039820B07